MMTQIIFVICMMFVTLSALADDAAGKVITSAGAVTAEDGGCSVRNLSRGADIFKSDTVKTAADATATLRFSDGTVVDIASASSLKISEYHFDHAKPDQDKFKSELIQGGFRAITGTIGERSPDQFTSKTRLTTLTVRGTGFAAGVVSGPHACGIPLPDKSNSDPVAISVIQGSIDVTANNKTFPLKVNSNIQSFQMTKGMVQVSKEVLNFDKMGIKFATPMQTFIKQAAIIRTQEVPVSSEPISTVPGQNTGAPPSGGGGDNSPCGTLNAVDSALPPMTTH